MLFIFILLLLFYFIFSLQTFSYKFKITEFIESREKKDGEKRDGGENCYLILLLALINLGWEILDPNKYIFNRFVI